MLLGLLWREHKTEITLPPPTGHFVVGRTTYTWVNNAQTDDEDDSRRAEKALLKLISAAREEVVQNLTIAYGNTSCLLVSLWNSTKLHRQEDCEDGGCNECEESADSILNYDIEEKGPAYAWLDQGAGQVL